MVGEFQQVFTVDGLDWQEVKEEELVVGAVRGDCFDVVLPSLGAPPKVEHRP